MLQLLYTFSVNGTKSPIFFIWITGASLPWSSLKPSMSLPATWDCITSSARVNWRPNKWWNSLWKKNIATALLLGLYSPWALTQDWFFSTIISCVWLNWIKFTWSFALFCKFSNGTWFIAIYNTYRVNHCCRKHGHMLKRAKVPDNDIQS